MELLDRLPAAGAAADEEPDREQTRDCLLAAAGRLPRESQSAILMHEFAGDPLADVAEALNCSLSAAKVRVHRGRRRLGEICRSECTQETASDGTLVCVAKRPTRTGKPSGRSGKDRS
jgi:DNA-directed RNA polymerase specialized sigma24 family protein